MKKRAQDCKIPEAHVEHMAMNGECPWCGAYDEDAVDPHYDVENAP